MSDTELERPDRPDQRFQQLAAQYTNHPTVSEGSGFGASPGLRVGGKIFAMLIRGQLVVKLPKARVDELVASGVGAQFDPGHGRLMKEWVTVSLRGDDRWNELADEAFAFVDRTTS